MVPKKKVQIVIDAIALEPAIAAIEAVGARGYTVLEGARGKGSRGIRTGHDVFGAGENAIIIVIASEETADRIVTKVMPLLERHAGILYVSDVMVARPSRF